MTPRWNIRRSVPVVGVVAALLVAAPALGGASGPTKRNGGLAYTSILSASQLYSIGPDGSGERRLAKNKHAEYEPAPSPDGTKVAFVSTRDGNGEIYVINADGTGLTRITDEPSADYDPAWSPNGTKIAFSSGRDGGGTEVYVTNADGTQPTRLTASPGRDENPSWSPDGSQIVFWSDRDGDGEIYAMAADGTGTRVLTANRFSDRFPAWSPNGQLIAFTSDRDGDNDVYVMATDGSGVRPVTRNKDDDAFAAWSPDGTALAFVSDRDDDDDIWMKGLNAATARNVTDTEYSREGDPRISPDGRVLFDSDRRASADLELLPDGSQTPSALAAGPGWDLGASWSPDGTRVAFASDSDGDFDVYVVSADGMGARRLTRNGAFDADPSWSPDGKRIAFVRAGFVTSLFVVGADGRRPHEIPLRTARGVVYATDDMCCPEWSPDGQHIALSMDDRINVVQGDGRRLHSVTRGRDPSWSPNGRMIVFSSDRSGDWEIYTIPAGGGAARRLTLLPGADLSPDWSPDGRRIAFTHVRDDGTSALVVMNADGSSQTVVPGTPPLVDEPAWQPLP